MKRIIAVLLTVLLLLGTFPLAAGAEGEPKLSASDVSVTYDGAAHAVAAAVENGEGYLIEYSTDGGSSWSTGAPSRTEVGKDVVLIRATKEGAETLTKTVTLEVKEAPKPAKLVAENVSVYYDGKAHGVEATLENGEGYTIQYSSDGGATWSNHSPSQTNVGKLYVLIRATKSGAETLTKEVTIDVKEAPKVPKLTVTGGTFAYDGKAHGVTAAVTDGEGYSIEYSLDGSTWSASSPTITAIGAITVKVRALKSGAETLTGEAKVTVTGEAILTVSCGPFDYDGNEHAVTAKVEGDEGYKIEYSSDGGATWSTHSPKLKNVGKLTVRVRATKGSVVIEREVTLEVRAKNNDIVTIVNCNTAVNVRKSASSSSKKLGLAKKGAKFKLLAVEGKWYKIQYKSDTVGWVFKDYVKVGQGDPDPVDPIPDPPIEGKTVKIVNCNTAVNVRKSATSSSKKLGTANKGATFKYLGKSGHWYKIQYKSDTVGWVYGDYVQLSGEPEPEPSPEDKIVVVVNCSVSVNVRKGASQSSTKLGEAPKGKKFNYLGAEGSYYKIQYTASKVGYIHKNYGSVKAGSVTPDKDPETGEKTGKIVNCKTMVNVREKASSSSKLLGTVKKGATVTVLKVEGDWTKVLFNGKEAYIFSKYVKVK